MYGLEGSGFFTPTPLSPIYKSVLRFKYEGTCSQRGFRCDALHESLGIAEFAVLLDARLSQMLA